MDSEIVQGGAAPGTTLGSYRIERLLGRGGMGAVFLAYDTTLHRQVALKVVDAPADAETSRTRLLREARNAAALNHPNICTIHEVGDAGGSAFIAMEFVEGRSLRDRLDEGALPLAEAVGYGLQAADALAYAHDHGVIHRDFKAANVIVTGTGRLKVVDFGLARRGDAQLASATTVASVVPAGVAVGTPYAMAPEQVRGDPTDARTDIWALGVLLYEMVSGTKPFNAATLPELFSSILRDAPAPVPDSVPAALRAVIERCLEKAADRRYQHSSEVGAALDAIRAGTVAPWVAWRYHLTRQRRVVSVAALVGVGAIVVGLDVGGIRTRLGGHPFATAPIKLAVLPFENLTGDPEQEYFSDGLTEEMITQLGRLHPQRLSVIARTSSMHYKKRDTPIDQIGRELGVDYIMEGSARREGSRIRVNATLIQVRDQTQRWADSFERELTGILTLQSDIARGVAESLALTLLPAEQARLASARPINSEAYEAYLKGHGHAAKLTVADLATALQYFELALRKDPNSALAYTGIASVWSIRQQMGFIAAREATPRIKEALGKALELDSSLPEAHFWLAVTYAYSEWNWAAAEPEFQRAIELRPNYAEARAAYSQYLLIMKRPADALEQVRRAIVLDPLSDLVQSFYGSVLAMGAGRFDEANVQFRNALKTNPDSPMALNGVAHTFHRMRRYEDALAAHRKRWGGDPEIEEALTRGYGDGGYRGALRQAAATLAARPRAANVAPYDVARLYALAGESDRALEWVEKMFEAHDPRTAFLGVMEVWDELRGRPRFQNLLRQMNLPM